MKNLNKDIQEIKERLAKIEGQLDFKWYRWFNNSIDVCIDFDVKLRPRIPTTATEAIYLQSMERRLKASIYEDIKRMEQRIKEYLSVMI